MAALAPSIHEQSGSPLGAVATAAPEATQAALEILGAGGNAVDAAVAAAWALCVCEPSGSGLGGRTVMLIRQADGSIAVIQGRSRAPGAASVHTVSKRQQRSGYRATTVPDTPAVLGYAQRVFGRLRPDQVFEPAIRLAEEGFKISALFRKQVGWTSRQLQQCPYSRSVFLPAGTQAVGDRLRQPVLAGTLRQLAIAGTSDFYAGALSRRIVADMKENGGLINAQDLAATAQPMQCSPRAGSYRGNRIVTVPGAGGCRLLRSLENLERLRPEADSGSATWYRAIAEALQTSSRNHWLQPALATEGQGETTHLCVADAYGNVVSLTQSIQSLFGAKVANRELGFLYNNYLRTCPRGEHPFQLRPYCRPRSNVAPTLVLHNEVPLLAIGAAGSRRIISSIVQTISAVLDRGLEVREAIAAPRIHSLASGKIWIEAPAATESVFHRVSALGPVHVKPELSFKMGAVQAIQFGAGGRAIAAADPRRDGRAVSLCPHLEQP